MKLYLISQNENNDYDTYDSAIVVANNEDEARRLHPSGVFNYKEDFEQQNSPLDSFCGTWVKKKYVNVEYIGEADERYKEVEVICASFNAG